MFAEVKKLNRKTAVTLGICAAIAIAITAATLVVTAAIKPKNVHVCLPCHNGVVFDNACKKTAPGDIACSECHGHENENPAVMTVTIRDSRCSSVPCHPSGKLSEKTVSYKETKPFRHDTHHKEFIKNLTTGCATCHAKTGDKKHFALDEEACNVCHFFQPPDKHQKNPTVRDVLREITSEAGKQPLLTSDNKPISECTLCHGHIEKRIEIYGKTFVHGDYEKNKKASCNDCHFNIIQGSGKVIEERCYRCHTKIGDDPHDASNMHRKHVVGRKAACSACHTPIMHGWVVSGGQGKENYRMSGVTPAYHVQDMLMAGSGGVGIANEPDPMYLATLNCVACHKDKKTFANMDPEVCGNCHEKRFNKILAEQMRFVTSRMRTLQLLLAKAKRSANADIDVIFRAETNYNLIKEDGSRGVHNIKYVKELLKYSISRLLKGEKELPPGSSSCTDRCHIYYKGYRTIYQGIIFRHRTHLPEQGLQCDRCHSNDAVGTETHGSLIIENKDCCKCHHKKNVAMVKSSDNKICLKCHVVVKDYRDGIIKNSNVKKMPDWMSRSVSCTDCHKVDSEGNVFMPVRGYCVECHNSDYGLLYDAWKDMFQEQIKQTVNGGTSTQFYLKQVQRYGMHNFRFSKALLRTPDELPSHD